MKTHYARIEDTSEMKSIILKSILPLMEASESERPNKVYRDMLQSIKLVGADGQRYPLIDLYDGHPNTKLASHIDDSIDEIVKLFQSNNRITWAMRFKKKALILELLLYFRRSPNPLETVLNMKFDKNTTVEELERQKAKLSDVDIESTFEKHRQGAMIEIIEKMRHFFDTGNIYKRLEPENDLLHMPFRGEKGWKSLAEISRAFKKEEREIHKRNDVEGVANDDAKKVVDLPNGWGWYRIESGKSEAEAKAMGHCGTDSSCEYMVSLREPVTLPSGKEALKSHVTASVTSKSLINQMKAKNNHLPTKEYHDQIIGLLEMPWIKGFTQSGGAYDFRPDQLDNEHYKKLSASRSDIAGDYPRKSVGKAA